jgi:dephospho-CoA kinase
MCVVYIGITGLSGTGKDIVANILADIAEARGFSVHKRNMSDEVRAELTRRGRDADSTSRMVLIEVANELRETFGEEVLARRMISWYTKIQQSEDSQPTLMIAVGIRNPCEVEAFRNAWENGFLLVSVEATEETRSFRLTSRGQYEEDIDPAGEVEEADQAIGIPDCGKMADWSIPNNGTINELESAVRAFFDYCLMQVMKCVASA